MGWWPQVFSFTGGLSTAKLPSKSGRCLHINETLRWTHAADAPTGVNPLRVTGGSVVFKKRPGRRRYPLRSSAPPLLRTLAPLLLLFLVPLALLLGRPLNQATLRWQWPNLVFAADSPYGRVTVEAIGSRARLLHRRAAGLRIAGHRPRRGGPLPAPGASRPARGAPGRRRGGGQLARNPQASG